MCRSTVLMTWVLLVAMETLRCQGTVCTPVPYAHVAPTRLTTFESPQACEEHRLFLTQRAGVVVQPPNRPDLTIRKQMTYTCILGGMP